MAISTKHGDEGHTRLLSGEEVSKDHPQTSAFGVLDEAVSAMGLGRALAREERVRGELRTIQETCFLIGAELATAPGGLGHLPARLEKHHLEALETVGAELEDRVELPPRFVVAGATPASAAIDYARAVVRRLERVVVSLVKGEEDGPNNPYLLPYLNRLSDILFLLARYEEKQQGVAFDHLGD